MWSPALWTLTPDVLCTLGVWEAMPAFLWEYDTPVDGRNTINLLTHPPIGGSANYFKFCCEYPCLCC